MPIEVHCPNPVCARVHVVKNRYAGMRGKCPVCASWMYVPKNSLMPSHAFPRPAELEAMRRAKEGVPSAGEPTWPDIDPGEVKTMPPEDLPRPVPAAAPTAQPPAKEEAAAPAESDDVLELADEKPKRKFSRLAAALLILGMLGLGVASASPYLERGTNKATGEMERHFGNEVTRGIEPEHQQIVTI